MGEYLASPNNGQIMNKYFNNSNKWSQENKNQLGLPRPFAIISKEFKQKVIDRYHIPTRVPIPWQSIPIFNTETLTALNVNKANESIIFIENRCAYCGVSFVSDELCIRWKIPLDMKKETNSLVKSDSHPFHFECMKQARIFCPHMKKTKDFEFETGKYYELRENYINELKNEQVRRGG